MTNRETMQDFAKKIHKILRSDRDAIIGVGGFTGEGKSTFTAQFAKEYSKIASTYWGFDRMTWLRKEMMTWIDGEGDNKKGQLPEYSIIVPDELFTMFYRRLWYESEQIDAISTFNMCRDRHLCIIGNVPTFWDLDPGFIKRIRFYVYIPFRGVAWIFEQENNPFSTDPWNVVENRKTFRKQKSPQKCPNFLCEILYNDWSPEEKKEYYEIRNQKRVDALKEVKETRIEKYKDCKSQRDALIKWCSEGLYYFKVDTKEYIKVKPKDVIDISGLSEALVYYIINGER